MIHTSVYTIYAINTHILAIFCCSDVLYSGNESPRETGTVEMSRKGTINLSFLRTRNRYAAACKRLVFRASRVQWLSTHSTNITLYLRNHHKHVHRLAHRFSDSSSGGGRQLDHRFIHQRFATIHFPSRTDPHAEVRASEHSPRCKLWGLVIALSKHDASSEDWWLHSPNTTQALNVEWKAVRTRRWWNVMHSCDTSNSFAHLSDTGSITVKDECKCAVSWAACVRAGVFVKHLRQLLYSKNCETSLQKRKKAQRPFSVINGTIIN